MMILCDASPVIFLGKINQLNLIFQLFPGEVIVPKIIKSEIFPPMLPPDEERVLDRFIKKCKVITIKKGTFTSQSLSYADNCILTYAINEKATILLSDDRLVRRVAYNENIKTIGTLGVLIRGMTKTLINPEKARELIDELIHQHKFRISIEVFEKVIEIIENVKKENDEYGKR